MKSIFLKEATAEKLRPKADHNYIRRMQQYADKEKEFNLSVFKDTGRLMTRPDFVSNFQFEVLHDDTKSIMAYIGGAYIELLKDGTWYTHDKQDKDINKVEQYIFDNKFIKI
jgi:hypothetical protein